MCCVSDKNGQVNCFLQNICCLLGFKYQSNKFLLGYKNEHMFLLGCYATSEPYKNIGYISRSEQAQKHNSEKNKQII